MHLQTFIYKGLIFGGFEGCVRYKADPYAKMYTQEQATEMLQNFPKVDITMTHCPPFGINDETEIAHQGFVALRKYLEQYQSKYWLHGHTYPTGSDLVTEFGSTRIIYVSADKVVEIDGELIGQTK
jgi:Icc-related predicted phosphoesterase